jgi:phage gp29-like protein
MLLDHLGRPVSTAALKRNEALSEISRVRPIMSGHAADGLTPQRLASILREAETGNALRYLDLAEAMEEKDLHYLSVMGTRKRAISQLPITLKAGGDTPRDLEIATFVEDWLERETLESELFDVLDAVGKGFSVSALGWDTSEGQWMPDVIQSVDPRCFVIDQNDLRTLHLRGPHGERLPLTPFGYMVHEHPAKSGLPIRGGLARPVAWAWMFKNYGIKDWVAFAEVYGMPLRLGRYENGATAEDKATLLRAVADIGADAAAIVPKSMDIEFVKADGGGSGAEGLYESMANFFDKQISKAVLGQTATTDAVTGGLGSGKEHNDVRGDIERADAKLLSTTVNRQIIRPMVDLNFGPQRRYPKAQIGRQEAVDLKLMAEVLEILVPLGLDAEISVVRDMLGIPEPAKGARILGARMTPPAGAQEPPGPPGPLPTPADPSQGAPEASQGFSGAKKPETDGAPAAATATPPTSTGQAPDPIDRLIEDVVGDGEWIAAPIMAGLNDLMASAATLEEVRDRLAEAVAGMDVGKLEDLLARSTFNVRLAGAAGVTLTPDPEA